MGQKGAGFSPFQACGGHASTLKKTLTFTVPFAVPPVWIGLKYFADVYCSLAVWGLLAQQRTLSKSCRLWPDYKGVGQRPSAHLPGSLCHDAEYSEAASFEAGRSLFNRPMNVGKQARDTCYQLPYFCRLFKGGQLHCAHFWQLADSSSSAFVRAISLLSTRKGDCFEPSFKDVSLGRLRFVLYSFSLRVRSPS